MSDEYAQAQEELGNAIDRARAGEDRALAQQVRDVGEQFVRLLNGLLRLTVIHVPENHVFDQPVKDLSVSLLRLFDLLGAVRVVCVEGQVYLNEIRIRLDERITNSTQLAEDLAMHGAGGLTFQSPISDTAIRKLVWLVASRPSGAQTVEAFNDSLVEAGLVQVVPSGFFRLRLTGEKVVFPTQEGLRVTLARAATLVSEAWEGMANGGMPNPLPLRRIVNDIVDGGKELEEFIDSAAVEESGVPEHAAHSRRVCTLSVMIGRELGLSASSLADLGVAALYHDAGYVPDRDGVHASFEEHSVTTLRVLLRQRGFHPAKLHRLLAAVEHHRNASGSGPTPILYARILRIADDYDTLTRARSPNPFYTPAGAVAHMASMAGTSYDAALFQLFVNRVGRYPPGTFLALEDGRLVVSTSAVRSPETFSRPLARLIRHADGTVAKDLAAIDLAEEGVVVGEMTMPG